MKHYPKTDTISTVTTECGIPWKHEYLGDTGFKHSSYSYFKSIDCLKCQKVYLIQIRRFNNTILISWIEGIIKDLKKIDKFHKDLDRLLK